MATSADELMECPVCFGVMKGNIRQCQLGHSFCEPCVEKLPKPECPKCRQPIGNVRNYQLEQLIQGLLGTSLTSECSFAAYGCKASVGIAERVYHEANCKFKVNECEMQRYAKSPCNWKGKPSEILAHFQKAHPKECILQYKTDIFGKVNFEETSCRLQAIDMHNGQEVIYYKSKVDKEKEMIYWLFQVVGLSEEAKKYCYEFEITSASGPIEKLKVTMMCESNHEDAEVLFEEGRSAAFTFATIKRFVNTESDIHIRFRIMNVKHLGIASSTGSVISKASRPLLPHGEIFLPRRHYRHTSRHSSKGGDKNTSFKLI